MRLLSPIALWSIASCKKDDRKLPITSERSVTKSSIWSLVQSIEAYSFEDASGYSFNLEFHAPPRY